MGDLGLGQTGTLKSTPKPVKLFGDDSKAMIYKNMGNNHNVPTMWAETYTVASGVTSITLASGITFHGIDLATAKWVATPNWNAGYCYITKNTGTNVVTFTCTTAGANAGTSKIDVFAMLGDDPSLTGLHCNGNNSVAQMLP